MAQRVFGDRPRFEKLQKIVRSAGLGADAGELQPAERLALDDRAGDAAVDIKIADAKFLARFLDMRRRARKNAAGQRKRGVVGNLQRMIEVSRVESPTTPGRKFLPGRSGLRIDVAENRRPDEISFRRRGHFQDALRFFLPRRMYSAIRALRFAFDHRADGIARIFRRTDLETARRLDQAA